MVIPDLSGDYIGSIIVISRLCHGVDHQLIPSLECHEGIEGDTLVASRGN